MSQNLTKILPAQKDALRGAECFICLIAFKLGQGFSCNFSQTETLALPVSQTHCISYSNLTVNSYEPLTYWLTLQFFQIVGQSQSMTESYTFIHSTAVFLQRSMTNPPH